MLALASATGPAAPAPTPAEPKPPAAPDLEALRTQFTDLGAKLAADDRTLESMVAGSNPVGTGWAPHMSSLSADLLAARDALLVAKPDTAADLGAKLGVDVRKLSEAAGSLSVLARQRATLSQGWTTFLDAAIANATAAAALLQPAEPAPADPPKDAIATTSAPAPAAPAAGRLVDPVGQPGDVDYCQTPQVLGRTRGY
jgi:hypothetical protein